MESPNKNDEISNLLKPTLKKTNKTIYFNTKFIYKKLF